jgi:hypothetical protein
MSKDLKGALIAIVSIAFIITAGVTTWAVVSNVTAMQNGYSKQSVPGSCNPQWVKP